MRLYIPDLDDFFRWMDQNAWSYVVLRQFDDLLTGYPQPGEKRDVDLLVEDRAIRPIRERYRTVTKRQGVKCDVYSAQAGQGADYLGHPYLPAPLANKILTRRQRWRDRFFVPGAADLFFSLLYHVAYQKAETSGYTYETDGQPVHSKYQPVLQKLAAELGLPCEFCLRGFHQLLVAQGYGITYDRLIAYVQNDFGHGRKSFCYASLMHAYPGELNFFVIRRIAVKTKLHRHLIQALQQRYHIITEKELPWKMRWWNSRHMRGGKWKRGGKPYIALVVFDSQPVPALPADRQIHPFVFNSNQFIKRDLRDWFVATAKVKASANALHSTDNEAEAVGHFPLFFDAAEQSQIFTAVAHQRAALKPQAAT